MKKFLDEFKTFIVRGNVLDLAVAVIIGGAFQKIITSMVNDLIMPIISLITGGIDFKNWFFAFDMQEYATIEAAKQAGVATLNYGTFLTESINFVIMAFVIFLMVKSMNVIATRLRPIEEKVTTKECPFCKSNIHIGAMRCPNCTSILTEQE